MNGVKFFRRMELKRAAAIFLGGAIGSICRFLLVFAFSNSWSDFPLTIFLENVMGSFFLGLIMGCLMIRLPVFPLLTPFFCVGILGSFTTFSNYSLDVVLLIRDGSFLVGTFYALASIGGGLVSAWIGILVGRKCGHRWNQKTTNGVAKG